MSKFYYYAHDAQTYCSCWTSNEPHKSYMMSRGNEKTLSSMHVVLIGHSEQDGHGLSGLHAGVMFMLR